MDSYDSLLNVSAVPQDDKKAAFIAESKRNRQKCYDLSEQTTKSIAEDGETFQQYLDVQSRFDRYTVNNAILIMAQKPDAQKLGDYGYWRDQNVFVKRMERKNPILILEPGKEYSRDDGSIGNYYNAKKLYDISQTSMKERITPQEERDDRLLVKALLDSPPVDIVAAEPDQMPDGKGAVFEPGDNCIYVRKGMDAEEIFSSLTPELVLAGFADGDRDYNRDEDVFHAYCVSYMLCAKYGFNTQNFDFSHAPEIFEGMEPQEIRAELTKSRDAANKILSRMAKVLEQNRPQMEQSQPSRERKEENIPKPTAEKENEPRRAESPFSQKHPQFGREAVR